MSRSWEVEASRWDYVPFRLRLTKKDHEPSKTGTPFRHTQVLDEHLSLSGVPDK